jgi:hypothetical protein
MEIARIIAPHLARVVVASQHRDSWWPTWDWTPRSANRALSPRATDGSQSAATPRHARCWSRPPGSRSASLGHCAPSASGSEPAREHRSRRSQSPASSSAWPGSCSAANRTTCSLGPPGRAASCATSSVPLAPKRCQSATTDRGSPPRPPNGRPSSSSSSGPRRLPAPHQRLAIDRARQDGRRRDTWEGIFTAVKAASSAAGH